MVSPHRGVSAASFHPGWGLLLRPVGAASTCCSSLYTKKLQVERSAVKHTALITEQGCSVAVLFPTITWKHTVQTDMK